MKAGAEAEPWRNTAHWLFHSVTCRDLTFLCETAQWLDVMMVFLPTPQVGAELCRWAECFDKNHCASCFYRVPGLTTQASLMDREEGSCVNLWVLFTQLFLNVTCIARDSTWEAGGSQLDNFQPIYSLMLTHGRILGSHPQPIHLLWEPEFSLCLRVTSKYFVMCVK